MLKSFYNPDQREHLEYHEKLLKMAEQERLANEAMQALGANSPSRYARFSLKEFFLNLFSSKLGHSTLALKGHK